MNNKGFAISAVLYTVLIVFMLFLAVSLSMISSSTWIFSNANKDLINGTDFKLSIMKVENKYTIDDGDVSTQCVKKDSPSAANENHYWTILPQWDSVNSVWNNKPNLNILRLNTRYGTYKFPNDIVKGSGKEIELILGTNNINIKQSEGTFYKENLKWYLYERNISNEPTSLSDKIEVNKLYTLFVCDSEFYTSCNDLNDLSNFTINADGTVLKGGNVVDGIIYKNFNDFCD